MGLGRGVLGIPTRWESWGGSRADTAQPPAMCTIWPWGTVYRSPPFTEEVSETRGGAGEAATCARLEVAELPSNIGLHPDHCVPVRLSWRGSCETAAPLALDMRRRPRPEQALRAGESESGGTDIWGRHEAGTRAPAWQPPCETLWGTSDQWLWSSGIPGTSHHSCPEENPKPPDHHRAPLVNKRRHHLASHEKHSKENRSINPPGDSGKRFLGTWGWVQPARVH